MAKWKNEQEAREQILQLVEDFYHDFREKKPYQEGNSNQRGC